VSFRLGPVALSFVGVSGTEDRERIKVLVDRWGEEWTAQWLYERRVSKDWIQFFQKEASRYEAIAS
jgi:hypothetical protein